MRNFILEDFNGSGQYLVRMCAAELEARAHGKEFSAYNTSFLSTIMYKVGYLINNYEIGDGSSISALVNMSDGNIMMSNYVHKTPSADNGWEKVIWQGENQQGKQKMIDWLNNPELSAEYRFATQEEIVRVVMYQHSRWRN